MAYFLSPFGNTQAFDANGDPLVGGSWRTFLAGTTTPATTYTSQSGAVAQGVQMDLNALGLPENGPVWIESGIPLKFRLFDASGTLMDEWDNISGIGDTITSVDEWQPSGFAPTYISATSFSVVGDKTTTLQVNRQLKTENTGGTAYSRIFTSVFAAGVTTVVVTNASGVLDSGLSTVAYGFLSADNQSIPPVDELVKTQTGTTYTYAKGDKGKLVTHTNAAAIAGTLPIASTMGAGWWIDVQNRGAGTLTITPTTSTIDGAATLALTTGNGARLVSDGTNYFTLRSTQVSSITLGTPVAATSGTSIDFTGIPATAKRITINFAEVSLSGTAALFVQLGDSGGVETSGYSSVVTNGASGTSFSSTGFLVINDPGTAASLYSGSVVLSLENTSANRWVQAGTVTRSAGPFVNSSAGSKATSAVLDRIRITTTNGTDTFDAGEVNISYE